MGLLFRDFFYKYGYTFLQFWFTMGLRFAKTGLNLIIDFMNLKLRQISICGVIRLGVLFKIRASIWASFLGDRYNYRCTVSRSQFNMDMAMVSQNLV